MKGSEKRIGTFSMFKKGIEPVWEDKVNAAGGEYQLRLSVENANLDLLNQFWETVIIDLATKRFPHSDQIAGVRIVDKSGAGRDAFRLEFWTKFNEEYSLISMAI